MKGGYKNFNVILIDPDVFRSDAIDCKNNAKNTPNICNFFSNNTITFKNHVSHSDLTKPSYVSTMSSLYPFSHGIWNESFLKLDERISLLPQILKDNNYRTSFVGPTFFQQLVYDGYDQRIEGTGKERLDSALLPELEIVSRGNRPSFIYFYTSVLHFPYLGKGFSPSSANAPAGLPQTLKEFNKLRADYVFDHYMEFFSPEAISEHSELFGADRSKKKEEIFNYFSDLMRDPALGAKYLLRRWEATYGSYMTFFDLNKPEDRKFFKEQYVDSVGYLDQQLGDVFKFLDNSPLGKKTIVILTSDHGEEFFEHGKLSHINDLYQELISVPLMIKIPGVWSKEITGLSQAIDLAPTILDLLGLKQIPQFQGRSLAPFMGILDKSNRIDEYQITQKQKDYRASYRKDSWKVIIGQDKEVLQLFDLSKDPGEKNNLLNSERKKADEMFQGYLKVLRSLTKYDSAGGYDTLTPERRQQIIKEGYF